MSEMLQHTKSGYSLNHNLPEYPTDYSADINEIRMKSDHGTRYHGKNIEPCPVGPSARPNKTEVMVEPLHPSPVYTTRLLWTESWTTSPQRVRQIPVLYLPIESTNLVRSNTLY